MSIECSISWLHYEQPPVKQKMNAEHISFKNTLHRAKNIMQLLSQLLQ